MLPAAIIPASHVGFGGTSWDQVSSFPPPPWPRPAAGRAITVPGRTSVPFFEFGSDCFSFQLGNHFWSHFSSPDTQKQSEREPRRIPCHHQSNFQVPRCGSQCLIATLDPTRGIVVHLTLLLLCLPPRDSLTESPILGVVPHTLGVLTSSPCPQSAHPIPMSPECSQHHPSWGAHTIPMSPRSSHHRPSWGAHTIPMILGCSHHPHVPECSHHPLSWGAHTIPMSSECSHNPPSWSAHIVPMILGCSHHPHVPKVLTPSPFLGCSHHPHVPNVLTPSPCPQGLHTITHLGVLTPSSCSWSAHIVPMILGCSHHPHVPKVLTPSPFLGCSHHPHVPNVLTPSPCPQGLHTITHLGVLTPSP
ncbi:uncharacterized protein LOC124417650 [Gallus gallus]|uniref:uncharacterized protein LOC124417650 n=1 Tax=Gallus gallus TaxID=9031 RepID=UPI001F023D26|nr:uncharacterized protein LOC124417650 [Gallus gallus]